MKVRSFVNPLSSDDVSQGTSARYRAVETEQLPQRHPEAGSSWPSWPEASQFPACLFVIPRSLQLRAFEIPRLVTVEAMHVRGLQYI